MTIFMWTLGGVFALSLTLYAVTPVVRWFKNIGKIHDIAEEMYPGEKSRQANFRDKIASDILRAHPGLVYESPEFYELYNKEMTRLYEDYRG